jgi:hypothetical protein
MPVSYSQLDDNYILVWEFRIKTPNTFALEWLVNNRRELRKHIAHIMRSWLRKAGIDYTEMSIKVYTPVEADKYEAEYGTEGGV